MNARTLTDFSALTGRLEAMEVVVALPGKTLLQAASAQFSAGQVTAILGPNGAGKSTLMAVLSGQRQPSSGEVCLAGKKLAAHAPGELARVRACVAQETQVAFEFSVREVVELGRYPHRRQPSRHEAAIVLQAMQATQVDHLAERAINTLSGGEKARAHLARALAQVWEPVAEGGGPVFPPGRPKEKHTPSGGRELHAVSERGGLIFPPGRPKKKHTPSGGRELHAVSERGGQLSRWLLLDEPTAALDLQHQHRMLQLARDWACQQGVGVVAVLHDLNLALRYSDRCVVLQGGQVVASGITPEVLSAACIEKVWGVYAQAVPNHGGSDHRLQYVFEPV
ncbi:ATP-binding cassette domain-containing protein [Polaromonas sp. SM01]|uniref:ATP-binding cassette domain-containing protein n=1 Tax=Polaromonas sp. SM01 TaxID=3085630 RepID=UPI002980FD55|nr:ATP-binding cassette domain-containing protein [Polaromonas sp. SM01]MDW5441928.1 ATP-binding cassette domain-containing protein [Polaromonas sp. SM01]